MVEICPNLPSEGLFVEEFITSDTNKVVWVINIPKHRTRRPVFAHKKKWQRIGDSLVELTAERENIILNEDIVHYDWSAGTIDEATTDDLDSEALRAALEGYCERYPNRAKEARAKLRELNLIEGRHPHIIISRKVAQLTNMEAEYTDLKGFDDDYYKDLILKSLSDHKKLRRTHIDKLLLPRLPKALNDRQKKNHIDYLLKCLRIARKIHVGPNKYWESGPNITD